jgi:hypothetical protein
VDKPPSPSKSEGLLLSSNGPEGTIFDKAPPTGPPNPPKRQLPGHLDKVVAFFQGIIADEGLLVDLCLDRAIGIVEFNYRKRLVGSDFFSEQPPTALHFAGIAAPLAVELYKQVLNSVNDRRDEYAALLKSAQKEAGSGGERPLIFIP